MVWGERSERMTTEVRQTVELQSADNQAQEQQQVDFAIEGMTCASCAMRIEKGLKKLPGILDARVNLATERATVLFDPAQIEPQQMIQKVDTIGYKAIPLDRPITPVSSEAPANTTGATENVATSVDSGITELQKQEEELKQHKAAELRHKRNLLLLGIALTLPVVLLSMFFLNRFPGENLLLLALTTPVWAIVGWEFHRGALKTLRHGSANMDTLISVGSTAAYLMSIVATFFPALVGGTTFYDTASLIITLIFLGKYLEARAKGQANEAIQKLRSEEHT